MFKRWTESLKVAKGISLSNVEKSIPGNWFKYTCWKRTQYNNNISNIMTREHGTFSKRSYLTKFFNCLKTAKTYGIQRYTCNTPIYTSTYKTIKTKHTILIIVITVQFLKIPLEYYRIFIKRIQFLTNSFKVYSNSFLYYSNAAYHRG